MFSIYEGTRTLAQESNHHRSGFELTVAYGVLSMAFLFEGISFSIAIRSIWKSSRQLGWGMWRYLRESPDLTMKTVFYEDGAALTGLVLAAAGLAISELFHTEVWDGIASLAIGLLLAGVALMLGLQSRRLLLGASANRETISAIRATIAKFPEVEEVVRLLTMQLGSHSVLVTGELQVRHSLSLAGAEDMIARLDDALAKNVPEVKDTFWELRRRPPGRHPALQTAGDASEAPG